MSEKTRYVRVEHSGQYLHMQQVQVYVQNFEDNVALASLGATASSSPQQSGGVPERVIDGDVNKAANWPNGCHTKNGANEWWAVDLQREYVVTKIIVHNRPDGCQGRLAGARVLFQNEAGDAGREIAVLTEAQVQEFSIEVKKEYPVPAYEGLVLPFETGAINDNANAAVNDVVGPFAANLMGVWHAELIGKPKSDVASLDPLKKIMVDAIPGLTAMPQDYKHFGHKNYAAHLCVALETNPFFAAHLAPRTGGGFELINYDPVTPSGSDTPYNIKIMREMGRTGPQVNFRFSVKPEGGLAIDGYDVFECGVKLAQLDESKPYGGSTSPLQYFASAALYDLFYVAQTLHASIHVFHYVLTNALMYASEDFARLNNWAVEYNSNINLKYSAVTTVLIALNGKGLLTSHNGLGGSVATLPIMKANIEAWGKCATAGEFHDHWFQSPRKDLEAAGLLQEFFKHTALGAACANAATAALEEDSCKLADTNEKLLTYIGKSGAWSPEENGIKTVRPLFDMMLITGVIHGSTLSMTRLLNKPEFFRWRNIEEKTWTPVDAFSNAVGLGTIVGVQKDKHVASSNIGGGSEEAITTGSLQDALQTYDQQAHNLQKVYEEKIQKRNDFNDVGFLLTDYCTEGFDGKQLTQSTYI